MTDEATAVQETSDPGRVHVAKLARAALQVAPNRWSGAPILIVSVIAFLVVTSRDTSPTQLAVFVGVLLFHEAGHLIGMKLFGFSDLRMFFLPFFGAAVTGRKPAASAVEQAIVSLLGPLPGIILALVLAFFTGKGHAPGEPSPVMAHLVLMLVVINVLNLLPILPLDGGRFFQTLLFARTPVLDVLFRMLAIAGLAWLGLHGDIVLGVVAALMLINLRMQSKVAFEAAALRRAYRFTPDIAAAGDEQLAALQDAAERATDHLRVGDVTKKRLLEQTVRELFDRVAHASPKWWQTVLLLLVWLLAFVAAAAALVVLAQRTR